MTGTLASPLGARLAPRRGKPASSDEHLFRVGCTLAGLIFVSFSIWRMWTVPDGITARWLALGALLLLAAEIWAPKVIAPVAEWTAARAAPALDVPHPWLLTAGVLLSVAVDVSIYVTQTQDMIGWALLAAWFVSMLLVVAALVPAGAWMGAIARALRPFRPTSLWKSEALWFLLIFALAAAVRLLDPTLMYPVRGDEGLFRHTAVFSLNPPHPNLFSEDTMDDSYIYYVPLRLFMSVFGSGLGPARFGVALWGLALIPPAYLLARELFGRRVALISTLILAVEPFHINWSRLNVPQVYAVTWTAIALYCVIRGLRTGKPAAWICAGLATGIAQYGHTDARFIPIIVALILGYELLRAPGRLLSQRYNIGWFLLAAVLGYGPTLFYVIHQPVLWQSRSGALLITSSGWLARESASVGTARALAEQVYTNAVPMLSQTPDADYFVPRGSMLPPWCVPFAVAGAIRCAVRPWQRGPFVLLAWGGAIFVLGGILVTPLFGSQHVIEIATPLALLTATGIDWVASLLPRLRAPLSLGLAALLATSGLYYFFVQYQPLPARYEIPLYKDDTMTEIGRFVHGVRPDATVYLFNDQMTDYHANLQAPWLAGDREDVVNVMDGEAPPPLRAGRSGAVFMFLPSYVEKMGAVKAKFPGGRITRVYAPYLPNHPLATVYMVGHPLRAG